MEITIEPEFIYYPAEGDNGGSQPPSEEDAEITGIKIFKDDVEMKTPPVEVYNYFYNNCLEDLKTEAIVIHHDNE